MTVVTFSPGQPDGVREYRRDGYGVVVLPAWEIVPNFPFPKLWSRAFWAGLRTVRAQIPGTVLTHTRFFTSSVIGGALARRCGAKWVHLEHGSGPVAGQGFAVRAFSRLWDATLGRGILRKADGLLAASAACQAFVKASSGRDATVALQGVAVPDAARKTGGEPVVAYVGRLVKLKNVDALLAAAASAGRDGARFRLKIVGDGPERPALEKLARELGVADRTEFLGMLPREKVLSEVLPDADVFVNPSLQEGLPTTVIEAAASGCRIIATDVGGTREIAPEGPAFRLVAAGDAAALAEALKSALAGGDASAQARAVREKFGWGGAMAALEKAAARKERTLVFNLTPRAGMLHYAAQSARALARDRNVAVVLADYYRGDLFGNLPTLRIRTNPSPASFVLDSLNVFAQVRLLWQIARWRPATAYFPDNHPWYALYAPLLRLAGCRIVVTQHDVTPHSGEGATLLGRVASFVNAVLRRVCHRLAVHGREAEKTCVALGTRADKIVVVPHGSYDFFDRWADGRPAKPGKILFFGRISPYKGLDLLLEAMDAVVTARPDARLTIAGSGDLAPYRETLEKQRGNVDLDHREIPDEEVHAHFEEAQVVVLPYRDATASGVIPVAYAFGKPVVATSVGTLPDFVRHGETGWLTPPGDAAALAAAILEALADPAATAAKGVRAREWSRAHLGWESIVAKLFD